MSATETVAARYPRLFHLTDAVNLPSIRRHGLLSTAALLDLHEVGGERRLDLERRRRPARVRLFHPVHGTAVLRDNLPSLDPVLDRCLVGMTAAEWYAALNRRVFFWTSRARATRLAGARANRHADQLMLVLDTGSLLARHAPRIELSRINSGATYPLNPAIRGKGTFTPLDVEPGGAARTRVGDRRPIVELTILGAVEDAWDHIVAVEALPLEPSGVRGRASHPHPARSSR